jgi:hypothetical protein
MKRFRRRYLLGIIAILGVFWWFMTHNISNPSVVVDAYIKAIISADSRKIAFLESGDIFAFEKEFGVFSIILSVIPDANKFNQRDWKWDILQSQSGSNHAKIVLQLQNIDVREVAYLIDKYHYGVRFRDKNDKLVKVPPTRPDLSYKEAVDLAYSESPWIKKTFELTLNKVSNGWIIDSKSAKPLFRYFYPTRDEYK